MKKTGFVIFAVATARNVLRYLTIGFALLTLLTASIAWAGLDEGVTAYNKGDYPKALREFRPLAQEGDASAQFYLGVMYDEGQGVPQDLQEAVK